jgi:hypothetical protein
MLHGQGLAQLAANLLELTGALMMANALLVRVSYLELPRVLFGVLTGDRTGLAAAKLAETIGKAKKRKSLQGLSLVTCGFLLQALTVLFTTVF